MTLTTLLLLAAALIGILYLAFSQQSFLMLMMGLEPMLNGVMLCMVAFWAFSGAGAPEGQLLTIIVMAVMAAEITMGFAPVVAVFRGKQADTTEAQNELKH